MVKFCFMKAIRFIFMLVLRVAQRSLAIRSSLVLAAGMVALMVQQIQIQQLKVIRIMVLAAAVQQTYVGLVQALCRARRILLGIAR